jgi:anti-sigma factor RsiW
MLTCDEIRDLAPAYVLGALERDEEAAVTEHLRTCPDIHQEVANLGEMTAYLDETIPLVEPPASLRSRILAAAADDLAARRGAEAAAPTVAAPTPKPTRSPAPAPPATSTTAPRETADRVISLDAARARRRNWGAWVVGLAAVLAIVALGAWNVSIQQQLNDTRTYQQRLSAALAQAGQPGSQVAVLTSTTPGSGLGGIAVMPATGNGSLVVTGLAPTTGTQVYEAWAILQGQPPTPVAGFKVGADGVGYFDKMPAATGETLTVAITLEPQPNPTAPSSAPIAAGVAAPPAEVG